MKIFYLEDHNFFAIEILEFLRETLKFDVTYVETWEQAKKVLESGETFDVSLLDVILTNGKTGVQVAQHWESQLGRIAFITGCIDETTLKAIENYHYINKLLPVWDNLTEFLLGEPIKG